MQRRTVIRFVVSRNFTALLWFSTVVLVVLVLVLRHDARCRSH